VAVVETEDQMQQGQSRIRSETNNCLGVARDQARWGGSAGLDHQWLAAGLFGLADAAAVHAEFAEGGRHGSPRRLNYSELRGEAKNQG